MRQIVLLLLLILPLSARKKRVLSPILNGAPTVELGSLNKFYNSDSLDGWFINHCGVAYPEGFEVDSACRKELIAPYLSGEKQPAYSKRVSTKFNIFTHTYHHGSGLHFSTPTFLFNNRGDYYEWFPLPITGGSNTSLSTSKVRLVRAMPHNRLWIELTHEQVDRDGNDDLTITRQWFGYLLGLDPLGTMTILAWNLPIMKQQFRQLFDSHIETPLSSKKQIDVMILSEEIRMTKRTDEITALQDKYLGSYSLNPKKDSK